MWCSGLACIPTCLPQVAIGRVGLCLAPNCQLAKRSLPEVVAVTACLGVDFVILLLQVSIMLIYWNENVGLFWGALVVPCPYELVC